MPRSTRKADASADATRIKTASTKLTRAERAALEKFAETHGQSTGEFIRDLIFREMNAERRLDAKDAALQEIVGVQLLLMNVLKPLATGQQLTATAFDNIVAEVHKLKQSIARKLVQEGK
jgi:hypothetical protein